MQVVKDFASGEINLARSGARVGPSMAPVTRISVSLAAPL